MESSIQRRLTPIARVLFLAFGGVLLVACRTERAHEFHGPRVGPRFTVRRVGQEVPLTMTGTPQPSTSFGGVSPQYLASDGADPADRSFAHVPSQERVLSVIWIAGRTPPPGLAAARHARRVDQADQALEEIRVGLGTKGSVARAWRTELDRLLRQPRLGDDELWSVAARVVGLLDRHEFSGLLALGLDEEATPGRTEAARSALHQLFGKWFPSPAAFAPFLDAGPPEGVNRLLLAEVFAAQKSARAILIKLFEYAPALALDSTEDLDPMTRAAAAAALGQALMHARFERDVVLDTLFARLGTERDVHSFHALLTALSVSLETEPFDAPDVIRLRRTLFEEGDLVHTLSRAQALARVSWREEGEIGEDHILTGIGTVGGLLRTHGEFQTQRGFLDPDSMMESLIALETLCDRAINAGLKDQLLRSSVRTEVIRLLRHRSQPLVVRVAAAEVLDAFARPEDMLVMVGVLAESGRTPALGHALLGTLGNVLLETSLDTPGLDQILDVIVAQAGATDPDLRRRALVLLGEEQLAPLVQGLSPIFLVRRLEKEDISDLARLIIGLIGRFGRPDMLESCMAMKRFDELASDPDSLPELAEMCRILAEGRPSAMARAAKRLVGVDDAGTRLGRLRHVLRMTGDLEEEHAEELAPELHRLVCAWAWELHLSGTRLASALLPGMLERIARVHWPRSAASVQTSVAGRPFDEAARYHLIAVVLGIQASTSNDPKTIGTAENAYRRALRVAPTHRGGVHAMGAEGQAEGDLEIDILRDRARFRHAAADWRGAMDDFRLLADRDVLALPDLRTALEVLQLIGSIKDPKSISTESFDLCQRVIESPGWLEEPRIIRMQDLRELSITALRSQSLARSEVILEILATLPGEASVRPAEPSDPSDPERPVWSGLTEDEGLFAELEEMRRRHTRAAESLRALRARAADLQD